MTRNALFRRLRDRSIPAGLGVFLTLLVFSATMTTIPVVSRLIQQLNNLIYDKMISLNLRHVNRNVRIVIIDIDEKSINREGKWPWPRDKMAILLTKLKQAGVVVTAFDMIMAEKDINCAIRLKNKLPGITLRTSDITRRLPEILDEIAPQVDNDLKLSRAMRDHDVVLGFLFDNQQNVHSGFLPQPLLNEQGQFLKSENPKIHTFTGYKGDPEVYAEATSKGGFVTNFPDSDGVIRHGILIARYNDRLYPNLALAASMSYLLAEKTTLMTHKIGGVSTLYGINIDGTFIPTDARGRILMPFWGPTGSLDYHSATDVLRGKIKNEELEGAIAILGSSMMLLSDRHPSPVSQLFPGIEMVGNMIKGITEGQVTSQYDWHRFGGWFSYLLFGIVLALMLPFLNIMFLLLLTVIAILGITGVIVALFVYRNIYMPAGGLLILVIAQSLINYSYSFVLEKRQKRKISQLFGQYVPGDYVKALIESPEQYTMEGQLREMTVLFSDIRNFTTLSEGMDASDVKRFLNEIFTVMTEIIFKFQGTIDKYVGDMIIAFWGAPMMDDDHAFHAIGAALSIVKHLPDINATLTRKNLPEINTGIGLATGPMNVGDMGSRFRRAYTVLGDTVNLGSRLEGLTKFYQASILTSDKTRFGQDAFLWRTVDKVIVKGKTTPLTIYEPLGLIQDVSANLVTEVRDYESALQDYYARRWAASKRKFQALKRRNSRVYLYDLYLARIDTFGKHPPPDDWEGVFVHTQK
ncbi:CHASE2 domain-containing protein [Legionella spiritensis]|uniref:CHASE2 domain-containing protein n=1 Tax=Legionella spiritensis TaxID=452 RepID=UPI000F6EED36|nr:adenylate/guanylate cyclase domain-containing protein [Legionella spiritensis]VEG89612.1 adenylate/guanylate cyclase transmembrane protein [Legionella spiritensis]